MFVFVPTHWPGIHKLKSRSCCSSARSEPPGLYKGEADEAEEPLWAQLTAGATVTRQDRRKQQQWKVGKVGPYEKLDTETRRVEFLKFCQNEHVLSRARNS